MGLTKTQSGGLEDQSVTLDKLPHGDGSSDGKFLRANNGADPTFETVTIPAGTTINNNADNRVITGSGTANTLEGEAGLTYNGQRLGINTVTAEGSAIKLYDTTASSQVWYVNGEGNSFQGNIYPRTDSNLDLGYHATNKWRDVVISGGIRYGNASDANYLDDYEEGTFSPTLRGNNTNSTGPITGTANYTKIGRIVHIKLAFTNKTGTDLPSGEYVQIHGLPFTVSGTQVAPFGMNYNISFNSSYQYFFYLANGSTVAHGYYNRNANTYQAWGTDQWRQSQIYHENTFTYMTNS